MPKNLQSTIETLLSRPARESTVRQLRLRYFIESMCEQILRTKADSDINEKFMGVLAFSPFKLSVGKEDIKLELLGLEDIEASRLKTGVVSFGADAIKKTAEIKSLKSSAAASFDGFPLAPGSVIFVDSFDNYLVGIGDESKTVEPLVDYSLQAGTAGIPDSLVISRAIVQAVDLLAQIVSENDAHTASKHYGHEEKDGRLDLGTATFNSQYDDEGSSYRFTELELLDASEGYAKHVNSKLEDELSEVLTFLNAEFVLDGDYVDLIFSDNRKALYDIYESKKSGCPKSLKQYLKTFKKVTDTKLRLEHVPSRFYD